MIISFRRLGKFIAVAFLLSIGAFATTAYATHSWGVYHWARTVSPFTLKLGDNVTSKWGGHLATVSTDWSVSSMLDTTIVGGGTKWNCRPTNGRVEVCNKTYGYNGWLGIASIWVNGNHITQGTVKVNDTYFNTAPYNTPAWREYVMCQEVGHTFGLDHQDVIFSNTNLGTCMDYTNDPDGTLNSQLDNEHPNQHDYDELGIIYQHLDSITTVFSSVFSKKSPAPPTAVGDDIDTSNSSEWGKVIRKSSDGHNSLHERDLGKGNKVFTFVLWVN